MKLAFELWLGTRYAGLGGKRAAASGRDRFVSFVALMSMVGIALGVAALIVVLSVMNGFQRDVRDRMLSVLPHIELFVPGQTPQATLDLFETLSEEAKAHPDVVSAAPFVSAPAIVMRGQVLRGVQLRGVEPSEEAQVSELADQMIEGSLSDLKPDGFGLVIGSTLASILNVDVGDNVMILAPQGSVTPAGFAPRMRQFTVVGLYRSGHYEYDSSLIFAQAQDAARLFRDTGSAGVRLKVNDMYDVQRIAQELQMMLRGQIFVADWTRNNRNWFAAVQTEKRMMFIILALIVAVAAFNLLSSQVMAVKDKQADIAILRSFGATPARIARIFLIQGALIGLLGTLVGVLGGCLIAFNVDVIVPALEGLLGVQFLPQEIYFISALPSDPRSSDIVTIGVTSMVLSLLATLYPSWRASRVEPAQVLRYD
ncbi:lipoprotein-releasing ABC transporter permease subunit [Orrella sp. 11846]|uniref:lipoprotein-releasing ABC transporter permease subunit n=1 Tax=Orrella sp. 11846 TaxID=3409913 RepID=UPI003B5C493D